LGRLHRATWRPNSFRLDSAELRQLPARAARILGGQSSACWRQYLPKQLAARPDTWPPEHEVVAQAELLDQHAIRVAQDAVSVGNCAAMRWGEGARSLGLMARL
jgi:hypothetical protein